MENLFFFIQCDDWNLSFKNRPYYFGETLNNLNNILDFNKVNIFKTKLKITKGVIAAFHNRLIENEVKKYILKDNENVIEDEGSLIYQVKRFINKKEVEVSREAKQLAQEILMKKGDHTLFFFLHGTDFLGESISHLRLNEEQKRTVDEFENSCSVFPLIKEIKLLILQHEFSCKIYNELNKALRSKDDLNVLVENLVNISKIFDASERNEIIQRLLRHYKIIDDDKFEKVGEEKILNDCRKMLV